jgi:hypothetical protein
MRLFSGYRSSSFSWDSLDSAVICAVPFVADIMLSPRKVPQYQHSKNHGGGSSRMVTIGSRERIECCCGEVSDDPKAGGMNKLKFI